MTSLSASPQQSSSADQVLREWQRLAMQRRLYSVLGVLLVLAGLVGSMWFADENNAGHFVERLPHLFDFLSWLIPSDWNDVWRALFDIASPQDNGTEQFNFPLGRVYLWADFYLPEYFYLMLVTINVALVSTIVGFIGGLGFCFIVARNYSPSNWLRIPIKRVMELFRAFPEIVIAGMFAAIISIGPVAAIIAIGIHCIGALTKLFYEVVENADMRPDEGLKAVGANWFERVRFGGLPQVLPDFLSYALLRLEINVRASTIIGAVGAVGIGQELKLSISRGFGAKTLALVLLLFVTIFIVDQFSAWLRRRLVGEQAFLKQGLGT